MGRAFCLAGATEQVREKVQEFVDAGIDELTIIPCGNSRQAVIETFAREVMDSSERIVIALEAAVPAHIQ